MLRTSTFCYFAAAGLLAGVWGCKSPSSEPKTSSMNPPVAKVVPESLSIHGHTRIDNYYWLNNRENPGVIAYLEAENAYTKAQLAHTETLQESLFQEMKGRIKEDDNSVPYLLNGYHYYVRYETGKEYPIHCRRKGSMDAPEEIMLDVNKVAEGHAYCSVAASGQNVSPDGKILAYAVDTVSRRIYHIRFKNLETGQDLPEVLENCTGNLSWANDKQTLFYGRQDLQTLRAYQIWRHKLGGAAGSDALIYEEKDATFNCYVYKSKSERYMLVASGSTLSNECRYIDADKPESSAVVFLPREAKHEYSIDHAGGHFYIRSNWQAQNFRLMRALPGKTAKTQWEEVIPHRAEVYLEGMELFKDFLVLEERKEALTHLRIIRWDNKTEHYLPFDEAAYTASLSYNPGFETGLLRYNYQSLTTPASVYEYDMASRSGKLLKAQPVLGGFDRNNYRSERIFATASDGVKIPISIVYHKNTPRDGSAPLLEYAYGSYGYSTDPSFNSNRLSLLDRGFIYAIAHVRGGQEMGRQWYEDGKMFKKKNTFTDFIACGEALIEQGYTGKGKLYALGGSAGGLLMGAIVNMRPDLYHGVIAAVPFVDVITTMLDESIPLTTGEFDEWGNPKNKDSYDYMLSYSPYDQVKAQAYPNLLVTTGLHDSQVQYWEPAKWVAKLRTLKTDKNLLLLHTNMEAGHGGASGRFAPLKEIAMEYAFLLELAGKNVK